MSHIHSENPDGAISTPEELARLSGKKIFFIDRDGTIAVGEKLIAGAKVFFNRLRERNRIFYLLTNNSSKTPHAHCARLKKLGLDVSIENVLVSIQPALAFLRSSGKRRLYWAANKEVSKYISEEGFVFDDKDPEALLLTYDDEITYDKLRKLCCFARRHIPYYATHPDITFPCEEGSIPDIGTFIKVVEMTAGRKPERIFGKPHLETITPILKRHGLREEEAVIIGDRLYTDIKLGTNTGLTSVLVLTGETSPADYKAAEEQADIVVEGIGELVRYV